MIQDEYYIKKTIELAVLGRGYVAPNPMVGAVIVKDNRIIGEGYHKVYGGPHAEVEAFNNCLESSEGATLYCSLEPCCHTDKQTPPCTRLIIQKKIKRVVVATKDPNPKVSGKGLEELQNAGIETRFGVHEDEALRLNEVFFKYIETGIPYVHLKMAQTLDGRTATLEGDSKWITSEALRRRVHEMRSCSSAIMVGGQTALYDNPSLNVRYNLRKNSDPWRVILGDLNNFSWKEKVLSDSLKHRTLFFTPKLKEDSFERDKLDLSEGPTIYQTESPNLQFPLKQVLEILGKSKISSVFVEGGAKIATSLLREQLVDKVTFHIAPKILGEGRPLFHSLGINSMSNCLNFDQISMDIIDQHFVFEAKPLYFE